MERKSLMGASVAATLPAALAAAVLVSAPFAGTTTTPLSDHSKAHHQHRAHHANHHATNRKAMWRRRG